MRLNENAFLTIRSTSTVVAPAGPPPVSTYTWSKTWKELMRLMLSAKKKAGARSGSVMWRTRCAGVAPSISAASWYTVGIACRPASRITITNPVSFHTLVRITDTIAHVGSKSQAGPWMPIARRRLLSRP